jgi:hypothetical protein
MVMATPIITPGIGMEDIVTADILHADTMDHTGDIDTGDIDIANPFSGFGLEPEAKPWP